MGRGSVFFSYAWDDDRGKYISSFHEAFLLQLGARFRLDPDGLNRLGVEKAEDLRTDGGDVAGSQRQHQVSRPELGHDNLRNALDRTGETCRRPTDGVDDDRRGHCGIRLLPGHVEIGDEHGIGGAERFAHLGPELTSPADQMRLVDHDKSARTGQRARK